MPSRILVLEPDPARQIAFRAALSSAGFTARTAGSGAEAAERLRAETFSLVLLGPGQELDETARASLGGADGPAVVRLAVLPDCVVAEQPPGGGGAPARDLPNILEALTRYMRFAPPRTDDDPAGEGLLEHWAEYDGQAT